MTVRNTTPMDLDPSLFDKLKSLLGRPDLLDACRRANSARHHTRRSFLQDMDLRSWRD